jgi:UDP-GlcNAc:undecaprenyl-phosphate GlcNAc-1-phosphate transferase
LIAGKTGNVFELTDSPLIALDPGLVSNAVVNRPINTMTLLLPMIIALVVSMMLIPVMVRLAPALGLIDQPDPRKVHAHPVPRVGGFGILFGALLPVVLFLPLDHTLTAFLTGAVMLFLFGVLDDAMELGHYAKFIGQFCAVVTVVYWGGVYVTHFPFLPDGTVGESAGKLFTVFAMVGMINAINHSDGLDGLAGGEAMVSLCCIAWLAFLSSGTPVTLIALSMVGGLLGFMRYNTYPAIIFMGDGGSQFVGYTLGFLAVILTQQVNTVLSPALPLLILGLPIADIIGVFIQRIYKKMNWFRATRNHIHHRLLDLGFDHHESVVIIYSIQVALVVSAALLPYETDGLITGLYLAVVASVYLLLVAAERSGLRAHRKASAAPGTGGMEPARLGERLTRLSYWVLVAGLSLSLVAGSMLATTIPPDFTLLATMLCGLLLVRLLVVGTARFLPLRVLCYMSITFVVYLFNTYQPHYLMGLDPFTYSLFAIMVAAIAVAIRFSGATAFTLTPTDFLVIVAVLSLAILSTRGVVDTRITAITLKSIILFYACELVLNRMRYRWNLFTVSTLVALAVVSARGMGLV